MKVRLDYLDALRGWAILIVIAFHVSFPAGGNFPHLLEDGARGVELFYMLSAFTLFRTMTYKHGAEECWIRNFFIRRIFRIAPMFYLSIPIYLCLYSNWNLKELYSHGVDLKQIISLVLFINGFFPQYINSLMHVEWSVAIEMMFYALVPFLFARIKSTEAALYLALGGLAVGFQLTNYFSQHPLVHDPKVWSDFMYMWLPNHFGAFSFGVLAHFLCVKQLDRKFSTPLFLASIFFIFSLWKGGDIYGVQHHTLYVFPLLLMLISLNAKSNPFVVNRFTIFLGKISFSCYLLHSAVWPIIYNFIIDPQWPAAVKFSILFPGTLAATMIISTLTYRIVELRGVDFGNRLIRRLNSNRPPASCQSS